MIVKLLSNRNLAHRWLCADAIPDLEAGLQYAKKVLKAQKIIY